MRRHRVVFILVVVVGLVVFTVPVAFRNNFLPNMEQEDDSNLSTQRFNGAESESSRWSVASPSLPEMVIIQGGVYLMGGADPTIRRERPQRTVHVSAFAISRYEVTFSQYDAFARATNRALPGDPRGWGRGQYPIVNVSWDDAKAYTEWLSEHTGDHYRLPTEAEWEYAARSDSTTAYSWGADAGRNNAVCVGCGSRWDGRSPAPVGSFFANAFGLFDMHGNVWEWTEDCWNDNLFGVKENGAARYDGDCRYRVIRGGSWNHPAHLMRSATRSRERSFRANLVIGFRVVRQAADSRR
ncbi:MAG: formylglycine-generating enzyme family protein [Pseudomonadota bacterium]|nr:formylglycine-generating enzyme family protein [Pseudomonadota bacterium]